MARAVGQPGATASDGEAWARSFAEEVEAGHAGRTLQLVAAVRQTPSSGALAASLGVDQLLEQLGRESSAAGRNRLFRRWLAQHREAVIASWSELGFPAPAGAPAAAAPRPPAAGRGGAGQDPRIPSGDRGPAALEPAAPHRAGDDRGGNGAFAGVAVFDFDQTLTVRHVGVFEDLGQFCERSLGGPERLGMLKAMLAQLQASGVAMALVTRNSRRVVAQALERVGLLAFVEKGFIFGFEDYDDEVPKSRVVRERILPALGLAAGQLVFADDDPANIRDVEEHLPDARLLHCPRQGLRQEDCDEIVAWATGLRRVGA